MIKKITLLVICFMANTISFSQENEAEIQKRIDSVEQSFTYQHGKIELKNGIGHITVPAGFKYLDEAQAERVLTDLWGNPKSENITLGLILPENQGILSENGYVFNIQFDEIGYVKDDDANEIDYDELLKTMQDDAIEENKTREKEGYETITIVGWASKPFYDHNKKVLHWAKEIKFGKSEINTLNYNIRILGRKGVLVLNAIATMPDLKLVQKDIHKVVDIVQFSEGNKYADFDPSIDEVAAWTIGGLVAGKVLTKVGFFAVLLKFWKVIALAIAGAFSVVWKKITGKKKEDSKQLQTENEPVETTENEI